MMEAPLWEKSKENAAPLERGRNVAVLERSLAAVSSDEEQREKERMLRHYERLVRPTEGSGAVVKEDDDVLIHWLSFIKFYQESFPSDTHAQFLLLERCFRAMCPVQKYADDQRFVRVCCMYGEKTNQSREIFNYMYGQQIGVGVAIFWVAWAFVAEKEKDFAFAEKVYDKAIRKKAQPLTFLLQRQKQFQRRMSRHWLNSTQQDDEEDEEENESGRPRGVLGGLSDESVRRNDRTHSTRRPPGQHNGGSAAAMPTFTVRGQPQSSQSNRNTSSTASGFAIFADGDGAEQDGDCILENSFLSHHDRVLEREQDRRKENTLKTERWNDRGALSTTSTYSVPKAAPRTAPPAFAVFVDEECAAQNEREEIERREQTERHRQARDDRTFRECEDGGVAQKLANDPLRYVRNPSKLEADQAKLQILTTKETAIKETGNVKSGSGFGGFNPRLLKSASGQEQTFEEARIKAKHFTLAPTSTNVNLFCQVNNDDSYMSLETSMDMVSMESSYLSIAEKSFQIRGRENPTPRNTSTASSTVDEQNAVGAPNGREEQTINTALALKELSMMFSSPAFALVNERSRVERTGGLGPILNESGVSEPRNDTSTISVPEYGDSAHLNVISEMASHGDPGSSFAAVEAENDGPRNPLPRSTATPGFETMALRTLEESSSSHGRIACSRRRALGTIAQEDPMRDLPETELVSESGFQVYNDADSKSQEDSPQVRAPFEIYDDDDDDDGNQVSESHGAATNFEIYQDSAGNSSPDDKSSPTTHSQGDTATFSLIGDAFETRKIGRQQENSNFEIYQDPASLHSPSMESQGDTATFSLLGDAFETLDEASQDGKGPQSRGGKTQRNEQDYSEVSKFRVTRVQSELLSCF
jgi:hypothetical protein